MNKTALLLIASFGLAFAADPKPTTAPPAVLKPLTVEEKIQWLDMLKDYDALVAKQKAIQKQIDDSPLGKEYAAIQKQMEDTTKKSEDVLKIWQATHNAPGCPLARSIDWDLANCPKK